MRADPNQFVEQNLVSSLLLRAPGKSWFDWYVSKLNHLQNLLCVLVQSPVRARAVEVSVEGPSTYGQPVNLYTSQPPGQFLTKIDSTEIALTLPMVEDKLSDILTKWFEAEETFRVPAELLIASLNNATPSLVIPLLDLLRGIEVFHRRAKGGTYISSDEFEGLKPELYKAVEMLPSQFGSDFKASLKGTLEFSNEHSLRKR